MGFICPVGNATWLTKSPFVYHGSHQVLSFAFDQVPIILPIIFIVCGLFIIAVALYSKPVDCGIGAAITVSGIPIYLLFVWWKNKPQWFNTGIGKMTS